MIEFARTAMYMAVMVWLGRWLWLGVFSIAIHVVSFVVGFFKKAEKEVEDVDNEGN